MGLRFSLLLAANLLLAACSTADAPLTKSSALPQGLSVTLSSSPTPLGYDYGRRGSRLLSAAVIARFDILDDADHGQFACISVRKGPDYAANDPDLYGYPGCTLLSALTGGFFEDMDSAQVVFRWKDAHSQWHTADNLVSGPTLGRPRAAVWDWLDSTSQDAACVRVRLGSDAVEIAALVVYTDVLYTYNDFLTGPEDGPAIIATWEATRDNSVWHFGSRDEVGIGARPSLSPSAREEAVTQVRDLIEQRTDGRYSLQARNNIGQSSPLDPGLIIQWDSGFDIVPTTPSAALVQTLP